MLNLTLRRSQKKNSKILVRYFLCLATSLKNPDFQPTSLKDYIEKPVCIHIGAEEEIIFKKLGYKEVYLNKDAKTCFQMILNGSISAVA